MQYKKLEQKLQLEHYLITQQQSELETQTTTIKEVCGNNLISVMMMKHIIINDRQDKETYQLCFENIFKQLQRTLHMPTSIIKIIVCNLFSQNNFQYLLVFEKYLKKTTDELKIRLMDKSNSSFALSYLKNQKSQPNINRSFNSLLDISYLNTTKNSGILNTSVSTQSSSKIQENVKYYLEHQIGHPTTQLTQFCRQVKIKDYTTQRTEQGSMFKVVCKITIPPELHSYYKRKQYQSIGISTNTKNATADGCKKLLLQIFTQNPGQWDFFKQKKLQKNIK